ncbi:MAG: orotidine-5'-phosphate decarboxylase [Caulobacterales bacterium]|nr:orotidine-5'-phosphate decarboxylase [Caulobacterales bacterium]
MRHRDVERDQGGRVEHFGDRLSAAIAAHGPLCVGLDPYPARIPGLFGPPGAEAIERFGAAVIDALAGQVGVIKPQIALFERFGPAALSALARLTWRAREAGLLVILDAKRGDIADTGAGYAEAYLGESAWLHADAVTVNPFMGLDTLEPWRERARAGGKGVVVLTRTSNAGARDLQELDAGGRPVWLRLAERLARLAEADAGPRGWSSLALVVGATAPEAARALRATVPAAVFLVPGFSTQGAGPGEALAGAIADGEGRPAGVLVNASRSVLYGSADAADPDEAAWREGLRARALEAAASLATAFAAR